jgi:hypothetical protein
MAARVPISTVPTMLYEAYLLPTPFDVFFSLSFLSQPATVAYADEAVSVVVALEYHSSLDHDCIHAIFDQEGDRPSMPFFIFFKHLVDAMHSMFPQFPKGSWGYDMFDSEAIYISASHP